MKPGFFLLIISVLLVFIPTIMTAQDAREAEIRRMENLERESVLKADSTVLFDKIWSPKMIVNTPAKWWEW